MIFSCYFFNKIMKVNPFENPSQKKEDDAAAEAETKKGEKLVFRVGMSPVESNKKIGPIRTHLYNYAFAKSEKAKGKDSKIIYRVDDTNKEKHDKEKAVEIYRFFTETLGLKFDITPDNAQKEIGQSVHQSERQEIYAKYLEELFDEHVAFVDKKSGLTLFDIKKFIEQYTDEIEIDDLLRGRVTLKLEDNLKRGQPFFPLMRSDKSSLYHLSSVVDDTTFGVTHVVRGQDKLSIAEFQEMVRVALGLEPKKYLHTPMLLDEHGKLLGGAVKFDDFIEKGILPHALISYMISSGYGDPKDTYPVLEEFINNFDYKKIHKNNGKFDRNRLDDINKKIIKGVSPEVYLESVLLYFSKNNKNHLAEQLKADDDLAKLLISFRRRPEESLDIVERILNPQYDKVDDEKRRVLISVLDYLEKTGGEFPSAKDVNLDKKSVYSAMMWILVGKNVFPNIEKVFDYLKSHNMLINRIATAKKQIEIQ